jgi:hypothetical protein
MNFIKPLALINFCTASLSILHKEFNNLTLNRLYVFNSLLKPLSESFAFDDVLTERFSSVDGAPSCFESVILR